MAPSSVSGFCAERHPSHSRLSTGLRSVRLHTSGASIFDPSQDPESLLKFFTMLATSSKMNLGFDTNVKSIGETNLDLEFTIQQTVYHTSRLLYDFGADPATGRGTRVFEVIDQKTKEVRTVKDCWVEDRPGKQMEHEIVAGIKCDMENDTDFHKHFIDICGYIKMDASGGFNNICKILKTDIFIRGDPSGSELLVPITKVSEPYLEPAKGKMADQALYLYLIREERVLVNPPCSRFRYQAAYREKGESLFEITSFPDVFKYIRQAADGTSDVLVNLQTRSRLHVSNLALHHLHKTGWVHKDFAPGNIIVVEGTAKISDFEFATRRPAGQLGELTKPTNASSPVVKDVRVVCLSDGGFKCQKSN